MLITPSEYAAALRRLETMRNEALHLNDRFALAEISRREGDLNVVFFGKTPDRDARRTTTGPDGRRRAA